MRRYLLLFCLFIGSLNNGLCLTPPIEWAIPDSSLRSTSPQTDPLVRHILMGNAPGICSMVEEIENDEILNEERVVRRMFNIHDADNRLVRQEVYSSTLRLLYTWHYAYADNGQLLDSFCRDQEYKTPQSAESKKQTRGQLRRLAFEYPYHESNNDGSARLLDYYEPTVNANDIADVEGVWEECETEKYDRVRDLYDSYWRKCSATAGESKEYKNLRWSFLQKAQRQWTRPAQEAWEILISDLEKILQDYDVPNRLKARSYDLPEMGEIVWDWDYRLNFQIIRQVIGIAEQEPHRVTDDEIVQCRAFVEEAEKNILPLLYSFEQALIQLHGQVRALDVARYNVLSRLRTDFYEKRELIWQEQLSKFWELCSQKYPRQSVACKGKAMLLVDHGDYGNAAFLFSEALLRTYRELPPTPVIAQLHDYRGSCHYENCAYEKALGDFNLAITFDPQRSSAYLGRACTFFDTQEFEKSIKDYRAYAALERVKSEPIKPYSDHVLAFASGLQKGAVVGITEAVNNFVPSLVTTMSGMGQCLWAFVSLDPQYTFSVAEKACELFDYLSQLDKASLKEALISPIYDLVDHWQDIPYNERGVIVGQVIGHCGVDVLLPGTAVKSVQAFKKFQELKAANRLVTLRVIASESPEAKLLLTKSLYSQKYYAEALNTKYPGTIIAGSGHQRNIDDLPRLIALYGGNKNDWVKKVSGTYNQVDLFGKPLPEIYFQHHRPGWYKPVVSGHWYENITTGKRYEPKIEVYQWIRD